ncbi:epidermal growth factor receptor substrate 15-like 1 [Cucurbita moschata]|uniref:Epidermal growth factor receptor substrate 15-like 1 n=1 Tax=Cucurbita moschata TaxID=3662 RepID=A0A6J1F801_CUCMO|nr:epidermal growth factor receptor substrate 15-like 1 [Cucurbita moschata]
MDQFDAFFRRADLDGDGRISGAEAVAFFQGSNLPKNVLAQIWMHADQRKTGFLGRLEFYNALRLVTVAQSKRELTPEIVKAALYGPAAAKIPPPKIDLSAVSVTQSTSVTAASPPQMSMPAPTAPQNFGFRGQGVPNVGVNPQYVSAQPNPSMRLPQGTPGAVASNTQLVIAASESSGGGNVLGSNLPNPNGWLTPGGGPAAGPRGVSPSVPSPATSLSPALMTSQSMPNNTAPAVTGNGFASKSAFGADMFSVTPSPPRPESSGLNNAANNGTGPSAIVAGSSVSQPLSKHNSMESLQSAFVSRPISDSQLQLSQTSLEPSKEVRATSPSPLISSGITTGARNSTSENTQLTWPKMKPTDVQKYTKVFMEVDTDRDGRITGEQARNLFLSWRLPREVLKQVWDLSDQDNDSMLSLREFCFALYLMERYREGRPLPAVLPSNLMFDETLLSMTGQSNIVHPNAAWGPRPGFGQQQPQVTARSMAPTVGLRPPTNVLASKVDGAKLSNEQKSRAPVLEDSFLDDSEKGQQNSASLNAQDATAASGKMVGETANVILDSKEKIKFYRTMMQEIVLHKSRCNNRLNEITERGSADKSEAESLGKKYEEKYKQVAEIASKLTIEEAKYRDVQERKTELHQAIINIEQGGSADGILQVRADRIQSDIEELIKALTERCKKHGFDVKSAAIIELPVGWQPGIPDDAAIWDEEWDKFEDEGFSNDLNFDTKGVSASKPKMSESQGEKGLADYNSTPDSSSNANEKTGNSLSTINHGLESDSVYSHSEDELAKSPYGSPAAKTSLESPSHEFSDAGYEKSSEAYRNFNESAWGAFDNNDDVDSVWGIKPVNTKEPDSEKHRDFFGNSDFDTSSVKTGSPNADSFFQRKSPFFDDSVPPTPLSRFGNSSPRYSDVGDHFFDHSSRFDSFSMQDGSFSPQREKFTRFDSISSSRDFGHNQEKFSRFDSMSSSVDFGQSSQRHARFDSIDSSRDFGHGHGAFSFDDTDPFGTSGPFKVSSESQSPKKSSDNWRAF